MLLYLARSVRDPSCGHRLSVMGTGHMLTASGLLFDVAGALRLFVHEAIATSLAGFEENEFGNVPAVAMRELIMPEASGPYDTNSNRMSLFYYQKRAILFLFIGFVLQLIGDLVS